MGALGVELETGENFNKTTHPAAADVQGGNATGITYFSDAFLEEHFLVTKLVQLLVHDNNDIAYYIIVVAKKHLYKGPAE